MKTIVIRIALTLAVCVQAFHGFAASWEQVSKEKKVHSQYTVQSGDKLVIDNTFGRVHVNTWDKNEITIDITVTAKAKTESAAQEILDRISFVMPDESGGRQIFCKTVLAPAKHNNESSSMTIDYTINAPKKNALDITNKYGDVYLGDFSGKMRMNVSYGGLDMQAISGDDKRIKVAFGNAIVSSIESGTFDISYSNLTIDQAKDIDVTNKFGKSDITSVDNLKIDQKYGNIEIGTVNQVTGTIDYTNAGIGKIQKSADLTVKYCGKADFRSIGANVDVIRLDAYYSNLSCHFAEGANLSADVTSVYSSMKKSPSFGTIELTDLNPNSTGTQHYKVKVGMGEGSMTINAHYSSINFR